MTGYVLDPAERPSVAVAGSNDRFAVRRIYCVGRNYAEHAREMGHDPDRDPPFFFGKPADAVTPDGAEFPYPPGTENLHFEAELVVAIGTAGHDISPGDALGHVWGYGVGNDLTRRDVQAVAKKMGRPWDMAKGFDGAAVIGPLRPVSEVGHPAQGRITLWVNDEIRQDADLSEQIWPVPDIISYLSGMIELRPGDLIMTGTPAGVGALTPGDLCEVEIEGLGRISTQIVARRD